MKKLVLLAGVLLVVSGVSYTLGRKHASGPDERIASTPGNSDAATNQGAPPRVAEPVFPPAQPPGGQARRDDWLFGELAGRQAGFDLARLDLAEALKQIETVPAAQRKGFITGVFAFVARQYPPTAALGIYKQLSEKVRNDALRALVAEWISSRGSLNEETRGRLREQVLAATGARLGLEVELGMTLASSQPDAELTAAWLGCFSDNPGRSELLTTLAGAAMRGNPDSLFSRTEGWTQWERERAARTFLTDWSRSAPQEAWNWYQSRQSRLSPQFTGTILEAWASSDPDGAKTALNSLSDPSQRRMAVEALGRGLAGRNTFDAVAWADSLPDAAEKAYAHSAIYDATPRGVGAAISMDNGLPTLRGILPGSPLESSGMRPGDQILEVRQPDGTSQSLYGMPLESAVKLIRGEPGSDLELRILRRNDSSGQLEEHVVPVKRAQLYLNDRAAPKQN